MSMGYGSTAEGSLAVDAEREALDGAAGAGRDVDGRRERSDDRGRGRVDDVGAHRERTGRGLGARELQADEPGRGRHAPHGDAGVALVHGDDDGLLVEARVDARGVEGGAQRGGEARDRVDLEVDVW